MGETILKDPAEFFIDHGGAHNAGITGYAWDPEARKLQIRLDDLDSDFVGIPGYAGERPVELVFDGVSGLKSDRDDFRDLVVHDLEITPERRRFILHLSCEPNGYISCSCHAVTMLE